MCRNMDDDIITFRIAKNQKYKIGFYLDLNLKMVFVSERTMVETAKCFYCADLNVSV